MRSLIVISFRLRESDYDEDTPLNRFVIVIHLILRGFDYDESAQLQMLGIVIPSVMMEFDYADDTLFKGFIIVSSRINGSRDYNSVVYSDIQAESGGDQCKCRG